MSKTTLVWVFKILGTLLISLLLWRLLIGGGTDFTNSANNINGELSTGNTRTAGEILTEGAAFEEIMWRGGPFRSDSDPMAGFEALTQQTWMANSRYNGYWMSGINGTMWNKAKITATSVAHVNSACFWDEEGVII